jgi:hypothetical protein
MCIDLGFASSVFQTSQLTHDIHYYPAMTRDASVRAMQAMLLPQPLLQGHWTPALALQLAREQAVRVASQEPLVAPLLSVPPMHPSLCPSVAGHWPSFLPSPPSLLRSLPYSCPIPTMPLAQASLQLLQQQQQNHSLLSALLMTQAFPPGSARPTPFVATPPPLGPREASIPNAQVEAPRGRPLTKARSLAGTSKVQPLRSERLNEKSMKSHGHLHLPITLATDGDEFQLSKYQAWLRMQIEVYQATADDAATHTRGRNKVVQLHQVGIRCRYCVHRPVTQREKGAVYFPNSVYGLYQASQNMGQVHFVNGACKDLPDSVKTELVTVATNCTGSKAGRPYWTATAKQLGLVDTESGIFFCKNLPVGVRLVGDDCTKYRTTSKPKSQTHFR